MIGAAQIGLQREFSIDGAAYPFFRHLNHIFSLTSRTETDCLLYLTARISGQKLAIDNFRTKPSAALYNISMAPIPAEIHGQRYISLATFRKNGVAVRTPIWFAEADDKLYFMTNSKLGKCKRIRNNPQV